MSVSPEWSELVSAIVAEPGVAMVIGGVDTGKTHFCLELANAAVEQGIPTAVVDADVGQSEVGAPGTIGMAIVEKPVEALSDLKPRRLYFVGVTSPVGHLLECAVGAKKLVDAAVSQGARLVAVDTTGLVNGPVGRKLKTYKTDLIRPNYLIGIQRKREIEHLLMPFTKVSGIEVRKTVPVEQVRRKPAEFRTARRRMNFHRHFNDAHGHIIRLDDVCFWNTWLGSGRPMKWQYVKFVEDSLKCKVLHAEVTGAGIIFVTERRCDPAGRRALEEEFKTRSITLIPGTFFQNLLVGLADENGTTLNVALLQAIDFKQRFMFVLSPIKTISPIKVVIFGAMRVTREGEELGVLRPGEL